MKRALSLSLCLGLALSLGMFVGGCEDEPDMGDTGSYFEANPIGSEPRPQGSSPIVEITPASDSLTANGETAAFEAVGGTPPYDWSVSDISKGSIINEGENSAVYQRAAGGDNVVICTDSRGNSAFATVSQP